MSASGAAHASAPAPTATPTPPAASSPASAGRRQPGFAGPLAGLIALVVILLAGLGLIYQLHWFGWGEPPAAPVPAAVKTAADAAKRIAAEAAAREEKLKPQVRIVAESVTSGVAPHTVMFRADTVVAPDGGELAFVWDFGDGSKPYLGAKTGKATNVYLSRGRYKATVTVTDARDRVGFSNEPVIVIVTGPEVVTPAKGDKMAGSSARSLGPLDKVPDISGGLRKALSVFPVDIFTGGDATDRSRLPRPPGDVYELKFDKPWIATGPIAVGEYTPWFWTSESMAMSKARPMVRGSGDQVPEAWVPPGADPTGPVLYQRFKQEHEIGYGVVVRLKTKP